MGGIPIIIGIATGNPGIVVGGVIGGLFAAAIWSLVVPPILDIVGRDGADIYSADLDSMLDVV